MWVILIIPVQAINQMKDWQTFSVKGPVLNILVFVYYIRSLSHILCYFYP